MDSKSRGHYTKRNSKQEITVSDETFLEILPPPPPKEKQVKGHKFSIKLKITRVNRTVDCLQSDSKFKMNKYKDKNRVSAAFWL